MAGVIPITGAECGLLLLKYFGYGSWKSGAQTNMGFQAFLPSVDENTMQSRLMHVFPEIEGEKPTPGTPAVIGKSGRRVQFV